MYIEQLQKYKVNLILYLPLPLLFLCLMIYNYVETSSVNTKDLMHSMIKEMGTNTVFVLLLLPLCMLLFVVLLYNRFIQNNSLRILTTSRNKIDWKRILLSFFVWGFITIVSTLITYKLDPSALKWNFNPEQFWPFLLMAILLIPMQTSFEEYLFRGHMLQGLGLATKSRGLTFILTSVLFGLMHIGNPEVEKIGIIIMFYYIGTGLFLGILTLMDEGLELALGFHAANNLVGAVLVTSDWTAFQTNSVFKDISEPEMGVQMFLPILILYPILLLLYSKIYKWKDWRFKLFGQIK